MKKVFAMLLCLVLALSLLTACSNGDDATTPTGTATSEPSPTDPGQPGGLDPNITATLTFATWDTNSIALYDSLDLEGRFQKLYPNVSIEIEESKDDSEYWDSMKIRSTANNLPDIMYNKPFTLSRFKDYMYDLKGDLPGVISNNLLADGYALGGMVLGVPEKSVGDYVFYWSDMFAEANVSVPQTWDEFMDLCQKLQDHFGADADYSPMIMGALDEWPTYPLTEFMPALVNGNGQNWNTMATQDAPFASGTDIYKAYDKCYKLFSSGLCGKDPLGIGFDQSVDLFAAKKASIMVAGPWNLDNIKNATDGDISGLMTFYLPVRDSASDPFYVIAQGDNFMGVSKDTKNKELALEFIRFYFSDAWYPEYIGSIGDDSTMKNYPKAKDPVLSAADAAQPGATVVMYDGGGDDFSAIQSETMFDYKKLGAQMFTPSFNLDTELDALNAAWAAARAKLGIG